MRSILLWARLTSLRRCWVHICFRIPRVAISGIRWNFISMTILLSHCSFRYVVADFSPKCLECCREGELPEDGTYIGQKYRRTSKSTKTARNDGPGGVLYFRRWFSWCSDTWVNLGLLRVVQSHLRHIRPEQHWSLMPLHAVCSTVRPCSFLYGPGLGYGGPNAMAFPQCALPNSFFPL
jgi:Replication factor RFC1 C terminal domain